MRFFTALFPRCFLNSPLAGVLALALVAGPALADQSWSRSDDESRAREYRKAAKDLAAAYGQMVEKDDVAGVVTQLTTAESAEQQLLQIMGLTQWFEETMKKHRDQREALQGKIAMILDGLMQSGHPDAAQLAAELMLHLSADCAEDIICPRAAALLDHEDPFARATAEWVLGVFVGHRNDTGSADQAYPPEEGEEIPQWYAKWMEIDHTQFPGLDHVRQVVALNKHRSVADLAEDLQRRLQAAQGATAWAAAKEPGAAPDAQPRLQRVAECLSRLSAPEPVALAQARTLYLQARAALREAILASAKPWAPEVAYVQRRSFNGQHNISGNSQHQHKVPPPAEILRQDGLDPAKAQTTPLIGDQLPQGSIRGADLFFDADRIVFSYAIQTPDVWELWEHNYHQDGMHNYERPKGGGHPQNLWEINTDGSGLRRVTNSELFVDMEPTYLPDGSIVFASDRGGSASECGTWVQNATSLNLYRVWPETGEIKRLTWNKDYDRYPHTLNDGAIGYLRWDYQERGIMEPHTLWKIRPDGTNNDGFYKTHLRQPYSLRDAMPLPNSTKLVAIGTGHHHLPEGALILVDPALGINNEDAMQALARGSTGVQGGLPWDLPAVPEGGVIDSFTKDGGWYQTPNPISEKSFLVSYHDGFSRESHSHQIFYLDVWGNKELVARDRFVELAYPMALKPRPKPPVLPDTTNPEIPYATCYVADVYADMPGIEKGRVKYLRISQRTDWLNFKDGHGTFRYTPNKAAFGNSFGYWTWSGTRVIGTVPVGPDGAAHFKVPVYTPLYFQALDENLVEVRRMRSHVEFQPGETRGCIGCHETRNETFNAYANFDLTKLTAKPAHPKAPPWGDRKMIDYEAMVQPIFENNCVSCHGVKDPAGGIELTAREDGFGFMQSYRSLFGIKWGDPLPERTDTAKWYAEHWPEYDPQGNIAIMEKRKDSDWRRKAYKGEAPGQLVAILNYQSSYTISQPLEFGSAQSKLVKVLLEEPNHQKIRAKMSDAEWETLMTWIDSGASYTGKLLLKYDDQGRPLDKVLQVDVIYPDPWTDNPDPYASPGQPVIPAQAKTPTDLTQRQD